MTHGNAVANGHHAELEGHSTTSSNAMLDRAGEPLHVNVARHQIRVGVGDTDERLIKLGTCDTTSMKQGSCSCTRQSLCCFFVPHTPSLLVRGRWRINRA
jgi:hypothetical protein